MRAIGSSNFTPAMVEEAAAIAAERGLTPFVSEQSEYSWLRRGAEEELLPTCERLGVGFIPYFPLASGLLTGKYRRASRRRGHPPARTRARRRRSLTRSSRFERSREWQGASLLEVAIGGLAAARRRLGDRGRDEAGAGAANAAAGAGEPSRRGARGAAPAPPAGACSRSSLPPRSLPRSGARHPAADRPAAGADRPGLAQLKIRTWAAPPARLRWRSRSRVDRALLLARGYRVAMTRTSTGYRGGNRERARFCNARDAALMIRIHADGSSDPDVTASRRSCRPSAGAGPATSTAQASARAGISSSDQLVDGDHGASRVSASSSAAT